MKPSHYSLILVITLCLGSGVAAGASANKKLPIAEGRWALKSKGCKKTTEANFNFSGNKVSFHEASCKIDKIRNYGSYRYFLDVSCVNEGNKISDTVTFDVYGKKQVFLHLPNMGSDFDEYVYCGRKGGSSKTRKAGRKPRSRKGLSFTSQYEGNVGKSLVDITLDYYKNGKVEGEYITRKRGNQYRLSGNNHQNGKLEFKEYTRGKHTANVKLKKGKHRGKVAWVGKMYNLDGRVVKVVFVKK